MSTATIRIPTPLRSYTKGADEVEVTCSTVAEALANLGEKHPGILERVLDANGKLRPFVNVFVGASDVRTLRGLDTQVAAGTVLSIVPAVAGGGLPPPAEPPSAEPKVTPRPSVRLSVSRCRPE